MALPIALAYFTVIPIASPSRACRTSDRGPAISVSARPNCWWRSTPSSPMSCRCWWRCSAWSLITFLVGLVLPATAGAGRFLHRRQCRARPAGGQYPGQPGQLCRRRADVRPSPMSARCCQLPYSIEENRLGVLYSWRGPAACLLAGLPHAGPGPVVGSPDLRRGLRRFLGLPRHVDAGTARPTMSCSMAISAGATSSTCSKSRSCTPCS